MTSLALVEIVVVLLLLEQISEGERVTQSVAILVGIVIADVVLFLVLRRAAQKGEFRDYDDDEMARVGSPCSWNSGVRTQVDPTCPSHGDGSG